MLAHERFIGFLIEHYAGNFPLWLGPYQVRVITLNDDEALINYAKPIMADLRANMIRVDADCSATPCKAKIFNAEELRVHAMLVIGGRDMEAGQSQSCCRVKPIPGTDRGRRKTLHHFTPLSRRGFDSLHPLH